ncbi:phospholipase D-like domain-containing protein DpdK [Gammaproteobacteria bacterium]|nr:phospholipase D-like domain-containing protein DpdK [Gammaproteobacteria bacterium]
MSRIIRKSKDRSSAEAADLLSSILLAEITSPSKCLWLISPWISDISIIDNRTYSISVFQACGARFIRLTEVLIYLASQGTTVVIGTADEDSNAVFLSRLKMAFVESGLDASLILDIDKSNKLHEKAIVGDDLSISGSMNITNNGVFIREELIEIHTDEENVAKARMDAFERFGGRL